MISEELKIAIEASIEAGKQIMKVYNTADFGIEYKKDDSPLTVADKKAHNIIMEYLTETDIPVLSEEGRNITYEEREEWEKFWLVDPLDGTKEFIKRNDEFTVNIALIEKSTPIAGVVYVPATKSVYYADKNGSFMVENVRSANNIEMQAVKLPITDLRTDFVVVGSRSHMSSETKEYIDRLDRKGKPLKVVSKGSSLKICLVAEGKADCYPRLGLTMEWDTAAGHAIALFAGKTVLEYPTMTSLKYNKENLLNPYFIVQ
ncbi:MAG: 3'(2'),5'-bisphosphate nucleotidase CysQ [Prolixibacteraceae bacterium]|jgi:3'(2'), 5'-bisphosphate nucleotidase|nr:3'(2'),5'-bisphosphate nucleotidase CysQ [Prolixibacteraceae bacterium]